MHVCIYCNDVCKLHLYMYVYMQACTNVRVQACMYACTYVRLYIFNIACMCAGMYAFMYVCLVREGRAL
jgi:hypothetical protein